MKNRNLNIIERGIVAYGNLPPLARGLITIAGGIAITTLLAACGAAGTETAVHTQIASTPTALSTTEPNSLINPLILSRDPNVQTCTIQSVSGVGVEGFPHAIQPDALIDTLCNGLRRIFTFRYDDSVFSWTNWVNEPDSIVNRLGGMGNELFILDQNAGLECELHNNVVALPGSVPETVHLGVKDVLHVLFRIFRADTNSTTSAQFLNTTAPTFSIEPTLIDGTTNKVVSEAYAGLGVGVLDGDDILYIGNIAPSANCQAVITP